MIKAIDSNEFLYFGEGYTRGFFSVLVEAVSMRLDWGKRVGENSF
jgi:hypothetical protein